VNTLNTGDAFGVSGFVNRQPRVSSARAANDVVLFALSHAAFEAAVERCPDPAQAPSPDGRLQEAGADSPGRPPNLDAPECDGG